jgi:hypothetical protein
MRSGFCFKKVVLKKKKKSIILSSQTQIYSSVTMNNIHHFKQTKNKHN